MVSKSNVSFQWDVAPFSMKISVHFLKEQLRRRQLRLKSERNLFLGEHVKENEHYA